jgi:cytochrome c oxidase subunit III
MTNPLRPLADHFDDLEQQGTATRMGMWVFIASEILLFGALFAVYTYYRYMHPAVFHHAAGELKLTLGTVNTALLLLGSVTVALATTMAHAKRTRAVELLLAATALLGVAFMCIKGYEWHHEIGKGMWPDDGFSSRMPADARIFFSLYFVMTGLHLVHMAIAVVAVLVVLVRFLRRTEPLIHPADLEMTGLYWHFVDIVWVFLYPAFYLL